MIERNDVAPELVDNRADNILRLPPQFDAADEIGFVLAHGERGGFAVRTCADKADTDKPRGPGSCSRIGGYGQEQIGVPGAGASDRSRNGVNSSTLRVRRTR